MTFRIVWFPVLSTLFLKFLEKAFHFYNEDLWGYLILAWSVLVLEQIVLSFHKWYKNNH